MTRRFSLSIHPLFWVFALLIGYLYTQTLWGPIVLALVILVSIIVHELGHALTAMLFKQSVRIQVMMFGGLTAREGPKIGKFKEFLIILNGPIFGLLLGLGCYALLPSSVDWPPLAQIAIKGGAFVNLIWTVINLFPVLPLDGGHLMRVILEAIFGARGLSIALLASMVMGAAITILFFVIGWFLAGALFFLLTFEAFRGWKAMRDVTESDQDEKIQQVLQRAEESRRSGDSEGALHLFEQVRTSTGKGLLYTVATESAAGLWADRGEQGKAYSYLKEIRKRLSPEALLLYQRLAYKNGDYDEAIASGKECFQNFPHGDIAFINALSHAAKREVRPAVGWLKCAKQEKMLGIEEALKREEFNPIRSDPLFKSLEQEFSSSSA